MHTRNERDTYTLICATPEIVDYNHPELPDNAVPVA